MCKLCCEDQAGLGLVAMQMGTCGKLRMEGLCDQDGTINDCPGAVVHSGFSVFVC